MTDQTPVRVLTAGRLPEADRLFESARFTETHPCERVPVEEADRVVEMIGDPSIGAVLLGAGEVGRAAVAHLEDRQPIRPIVVVADPEDVEWVLTARDRGADAHVLRVGEPGVDAELVGRELESLLEKVVQPPPMDTPGVEELLWNLFERSPLPLKVVAPDGTIERCNRAYVRMLGYDAIEEIQGRSAHTLLHPDDIERGHEVLSRLYRGDVEYARVELRERRVDGGLAWTDHVAFVMPSRSFQERKAFVISVDVSRQKEAERRAERSVRMQALGELAGGVAHDFNNVLSVVGTVGHLLRRKLRDDGHEEYLDLLDRIERAVDSGTSLTEQLMAFGRERPSERAAADLNASIDEVGQLLARTLSEHVVLEFDLDASDPAFGVDSGRLQQVIMNLAVNARDAIEDEGTLLIGTDRVLFDDHPAPPPGLGPGEYALLRVRDDGIGMDAETIEHIFEPFFTTKTSEQGTGLGLATVYKIVDDAGGHIDVDSEPGEGTTFEIYLPATSESPDREPDPSSGEPVDTVEEAPDGGAGRILLVEDEADLREPYRIYLEREGHQVVSAGTYGKAREQFDRRSDEIDLIVADVVLPDGSGVDLVGELRDRSPEIGVVYVSGYAPDLVVEREGASEDWTYLRKPVAGDELVATVGEVLE